MSYPMKHHETLLKLKILNNKTLFYHFDIVLMWDASRLYQSDTKVFHGKNIRIFFSKDKHFRYILESGYKYLYFIVSLL